MDLYQPLLIKMRLTAFLLCIFLSFLSTCSKTLVMLQYFMYLTLKPKLMLLRLSPLHQMEKFECQKNDIFDIFGHTETLHAVFILVLWQMQVKFQICSYWWDLINFKIIYNCESYLFILCHPVTTEITAPTLWIKQLVYKENKQNNSSSRRIGERKIVLTFKELKAFIIF